MDDKMNLAKLDLVLSHRDRERQIERTMAVQGISGKDAADQVRGRIFADEPGCRDYVVTFYRPGRIVCETKGRCASPRAALAIARYERGDVVASCNASFRLAD